MSNHSIYLIAYPMDSAFEEKLDEFLLNYENDDKDMYACCVTELPSDNVQAIMVEMCMAALKEDADNE